MKTENYTISALFLIGFFGIFLLMNFQPGITGDEAPAVRYEKVNAPEFVKSTVSVDTLSALGSY